MKMNGKTLVGRLRTIAFAAATLSLSMQAFAGPDEDLFAACRTGNLDAAQKALSSGASANALDASGNSALNSAIFYPEITQLLLDKGADPNLGKYTPLTSAATFYSTEVMKLLLAKGADANKVATIETDPAATYRKMLADEQAKGKAANKTTIKVYEDLIKQSTGPVVITTTPLQTVIKSTNCAECLELLLKAGANAKETDKASGGNMLHMIAASGATAETRATGYQASNTYLENNLGYKTPAWFKNLSPDLNTPPDALVKMLVDAGVDINAKNAAGQTPAEVANSVNKPMVPVLARAGAKAPVLGPGTPTPFSEANPDPSKVKVSFDFPMEGRNGNGGGYSANVDKLNPKPKKVALISYYLYDPGKGKVTGGSYTGTVSTSVWRTPDHVAQKQIDGFYERSIDALKAGFKENGIELLTPAEFLDTDEKAQFYYGFNPETAKKEKTTVTKRGAASSNVWDVAESSVTTLKISPGGMGYRAFFVANENPDESGLTVHLNTGVFGANRKLTSSLGYDLAKELGVDAVVVVYICTRKVKQLKDDYGVNAVVTTMLGPNPSKEVLNDPEAKNKGQFYCGTRTYYSDPLLFQSDKVPAPQSGGMDHVLKAHAHKMSKYVLGEK